jgi:hypothetical protein
MLNEKNQGIQYIPLHILAREMRVTDSLIRQALHYWINRACIEHHEDGYALAEGITTDDTAPRQQGGGWIYVIGNREYGWYKVGRTINLRQRLDTLLLLPFPLEIVTTLRTANPPQSERTLHKIFAESRINGEWFALSDTDLNWLRSLKEAPV